MGFDKVDEQPIKIEELIAQISRSILTYIESNNIHKHEQWGEWFRRGLLQYLRAYERWGKKKPPIE
jgi:hypothetical protein